MTGDGRANALVGFPDTSYLGALNAGEVVIYAAGSWAFPLHARFGPREHSGHGAAVATLGDLDGDQVPDFAAGTPRGLFLGSPTGFVRT